MTDSVIPLPDELAPFFAALEPAQRIAAQLVTILNAAADPAYKSRYRRRWWQILEDRVKLGAMTSESVTRWSSSVSGRLGGTMGRNAEQRGWWAELVAQSDVPDGQVLEALQEDAGVAIAFCRAYGESRRAAWELGQDDG